MIARILKFPIRKDITKHNKRFNHVSLVRSMPLQEKIPLLAKYHKKKLIALILALIIIKTYNLQRPIMRKILSIRSPLNYLHSLVVEERKIPGTILEQHYAGVDLSAGTTRVLTSLFVQADRELFFGVGRYYLFQVYRDLGAIEGEEQTRKFWQASGFFKQRNQKASGVGLVEYMTIFEQGLAHVRKRTPEMTQQQFLRLFAQKFIQKIPQVLAWERKFNQERSIEFLKNMPGQNQKKKDAIIQIMKVASLENGEASLSQDQVEQKIKQLGLKGMNLTDRMLYWDLKKTWDVIKAFSIERQMGHPLTTDQEKRRLSIQKERVIQRIELSQLKIKQIEKDYQNLYNQAMF